MLPNLHHYYLARVVLEATTPLSVTAGGGDGVFDVVLARDANGLPILPGTAIAGVLRHLFWHIHGKDAMQKLFGSQLKDKCNPSLLLVSWGCIHDSQGHPVEGLLLNDIKDDLLKKVLGDNAAPPTRDRVRINHRGTATHHGKFDRTVLPAGHRFSTELALWSDQANDPRWQQVLELLTHPLFRIGGNTRAGLGRLTPISIHTGEFDLKTPAGRAAFLQLTGVVTPNKDVPKPLPQKHNKSISKNDIRVVGVTKISSPILTVKLPLDSIGSIAGLTPLSLVQDGSRFPDFVTLTLKLKPRGFWRIGQGTADKEIDSNGKTVNLYKVDGNDKPADMLPKLETRIDWDSGAGKVGPAHLLVPATSLKGALSHRVAFHANRRAGRWATSALLSTEDGYSKESCAEVRELFGFIEDNKVDTPMSVENQERPSPDSIKQNGQGDKLTQVGRVIFDDGFVEFTTNDLQLMMHNAIDRFTGGVREHMLFMEELVWNKPIEISWVIATKDITNNARLALQDALNDLCQGRLSLGAGVSKGHGLFTGEVTWGDGGTWINTVISAQTQDTNTEEQAA